MTLDFVDALTGATVALSAIDGRKITVQIDKIVLTGHDFLVPGEGMPIPNRRGKKGNSRLCFDIQEIPDLWTPQLQELRRLLQSFPKPNVGN